MPRYSPEEREENYREMDRRRRNKREGNRMGPEHGPSGELLLKRLYNSLSESVELIYSLEDKRAPIQEVKRSVFNAWHEVRKIIGE